MVALIEMPLEDLAERTRRLMSGRSRTLIGIAGAPGAGKTTLVDVLVHRLGNESVALGMDGFHLAQSELERLDRADRKGAPDTFDPSGYVSLLRRLRANDEPVVYAPLFRRDLDEPIANCVAIPQQVRCVITEGNYLLLEDDGWRDVRTELDEVWYLEVSSELRQQRLIRRRMGYGSDAAVARTWTLGSDERNAQTVIGTRERADLIVRLIDR